MAPPVRRFLSNYFDLLLLLLTNSSKLDGYRPVHVSLDIYYTSVDINYVITAHTFRLLKVRDGDVWSR